MNTSILFKNSSIWIGFVCLRLYMFLIYYSKTFNKSSLFYVIYIKDNSLLSKGSTSNYLNCIPFFYFNFFCILLYYNTSGANETIFINCFSLNSLATGPKIRVPLISPVSFNKNNRIVVKSDVRPIASSNFFFCSNNYCSRNLTFFNISCRL